MELYLTPLFINNALVCFQKSKSQERDEEMQRRKQTRIWNRSQIVEVKSSSLLLITYFKKLPNLMTYDKHSKFSLRIQPLNSVLLEYFPVLDIKAT